MHSSRHPKPITMSISCLSLCLYGCPCTDRNCYALRLETRVKDSRQNHHFEMEKPAHFCDSTDCFSGHLDNEWSFEACILQVFYGSAFKSWLLIGYWLHLCWYKDAVVKIDLTEGNNHWRLFLYTLQRAKRNTLVWCSPKRNEEVYWYQHRRGSLLVRAVWRGR